MAALEITGRRSGRVVSFPVVIADVDDGRYLVSMLGARPHIPVDRKAPLAEFAPIAADYPVFRLHADPS